ncbi:MAG TPA: response regulator [Methylocella sp.]
MEAKAAKSRCVVLIVEDEPFVRLTGADLLAEAGFEVLEAGNGDEALRILEATPEVRVVFSDVEMPGSLDGLGLARRICQRWPSIGIVLTSGHRVRAEMMPCEGRFLPKPYDGQALVRQIEEIVNQ